MRPPTDTGGKRAWGVRNSPTVLERLRALQPPALLAAMRDAMHPPGRARDVDRAPVDVEIDAPLYAYLARLSCDFLIARCADIPQNTIALLRPNHRFIAAFMLGANHELTRELRWREIAIPPRATVARRFWERSTSDHRDIPPIAEWQHSLPLGRHLAGDELRSVVFLRAEFLRIYQDAVLELEGPGGPRILFSLPLADDTLLLGTNLSRQQLVEARLVISEHPFLLRFGYDRATDWEWFSSRTGELGPRWIRAQEMSSAVLASRTVRPDEQHPYALASLQEAPVVG
jgi:hypothetical protein